MNKEEIWDICNPSWSKNFVCKLNNNGKWRLEERRTGKIVYGKWIFTINPKYERIRVPTNADQRNFFTGLLEAEWRNDNFVFEDGMSRPPQKDIKLKMFQSFLDKIKERFNQGIERGIDFYINKLGVDNNDRSND